MLVYIFTCLFVLGEDARRMPASSHFRFFHNSERLHINYASTCFKTFAHYPEINANASISQNIDCLETVRGVWECFCALVFNQVQCSMANLLYFSCGKVLQIPRWQQRGYFFMFIQGLS